MAHSPRSEPIRVYWRFCKLTRQKPGQLNLSLQTESQFQGLVGQFFIDRKRREFFGAPKRKKFVAKRSWIIAWISETEEQVKKRSYVKRRSLTDNLWTVIGRLYWNYAARIILRGEYRAMKNAVSDNEIEKRLQKHYGYLPRVKTAGWFAEVKKGPPLDLAYQDTADSLRQS